MKRRLVTILSALSLVLFMAAGLLWVRSALVLDDCGLRFAVADRFSDPPDDRSYAAQEYHVVTNRGSITLAYTKIENSEQAFISDLFWTTETPPAYWDLVQDEVRGCLGFGCGVVGPYPEHGPYPYTTQHILRLPLWFLVVTPLWFVLSWLGRRYHQQHRRMAGMCLVCGYDLRASVGRCPECGAPITKPMNEGEDA